MTADRLRKLAAEWLKVPATDLTEDAATAALARRVLDARKRKRVAEAWLRTSDARWSSLPKLRRLRQAAGLCVVCAHDRPADRHWCCSKAHEKLRQHTLRRVLAG